MFTSNLVRLRQRFQLVNDAVEKATLVVFAVLLMSLLLDFLEMARRFWVMLGVVGEACCCGGASGVAIVSRCGVMAS